LILGRSQFRSSSRNLWPAGHGVTSSATHILYSRLNDNSRSLSLVAWDPLRSSPSMASKNAFHPWAFGCAGADGLAHDCRISSMARSTP